MLLSDYKGYKASFRPFAAFAAFDRRYFGKHVIIDLALFASINIFALYLL